MYCLQIPLLKQLLTTQVLVQRSMCVFVQRMEMSNYFAGFIERVQLQQDLEGPKERALS